MLSILQGCRSTPGKPRAVSNRSQVSLEQLEKAAGTGWPTKPMVWAAINAPVHDEESREAIDSWDVTGVVDTREKINSLQLQVKNNDNVAHKKTLIDYIYVVVEWD